MDKKKTVPTCGGEKPIVIDRDELKKRKNLPDEIVKRKTKNKKKENG